MPIYQTHPTVRELALLISFDRTCDNSQPKNQGKCRIIFSNAYRKLKIWERIHTASSNFKTKPTLPEKTKGKHLWALEVCEHEQKHDWDTSEHRQQIN